MNNPPPTSIGGVFRILILPHPNDQRDSEYLRSPPFKTPDPQDFALSLWHFDTGGVAAWSRWLSEATPPENGTGLLIFCVLCAFCGKNGLYFKIRNTERGKQTSDRSMEKTSLWPQKAQRAQKG